MSNNRKNKCLFGLLGLIVLICLSVFILLIYMADPSSYLAEDTISSKQGANIFNPQTIIPDITNNDVTIFLEKDPDKDYSYLENNNNGIVLTDQELYEIAQYYFIYVWGETVEGWRLVNIYYKLDNCSRGFNGKYSVNYVFENNFILDGQKVIEIRKIGISIWKNHIGWSEKVVDRTSLSYGINLEDINLFGMDIYDIAEKHGGYEIHAEKENTCDSIDIRLYGNTMNWEIDYNDRLGHDLAEIKVNFKTGEVKK